MNQNIDGEKIQTPGTRFYLMRVSVGPVQEFISEARKTIDLYIGSHLLSEVTKKSMKPITKNYGRDAVIYPFIEDSKFADNSIPNLYMAVIPEDALDTIIPQMEKEIYDFLKEKGDKVLGKMPDYTLFEALWRYQIDNLFYLNWVAIPIIKDELNNSYRTKVRYVQDCLEERKLTRTFGYWEGSNAKKCVQCGHRESIRDEIYLKLQKDKKFRSKIKKNEKLCAVCLFKRFLEPKDIEKDKPGFESVVDVSVRNFKKLLVENYKIDEEVQDYLKSINEIIKFLDDIPADKIEDLSGEWFYLDNLSNNYLKNEYEVENTRIKQLEELSKNAQDALDAVYKKVDKTPSKYYTIVSMDGDDMGKLMSGEYLDDQKFTIDYQKQLSRILRDIGAKSSDLIKEPIRGNGFCVYSGGDDLLAFLPIERALPVINDTRFIFSEEFKKIGEKPTSSAGIVILHYHYPLRKALNEARKSIEKAKEWFKDKDAFVITLIVSSGTEITWGSKWLIPDFPIQEDNSSITIAQIHILDILARFVSFMTEYPKDRLSPAFIHDFLEELPVFYSFNEDKKWHLDERMFKSEFKRLLKRHIPEESKLWNDRFQSCVNTLCLFTELFAFMANPDNSERMNIDIDNQNCVKDNFEHFLQISSFLAREQTGDSDEP